jgi:Importin repeat
MYPMLDTLPRLPNNHLPRFLNTLTPLCTTNPNLFTPHLSALLTFLPGLILPTVDPGPTPTVARPFPTAQLSFSFPPVVSQEDGNRDDEVDDEKMEVRIAALEFMVSLSEAKPSMVRRHDGWVPAVVRGCMEGMGSFPDDQTSLKEWLELDVSSRKPFCLIHHSHDIYISAFRRNHGRVLYPNIRAITRSARLCPWRKGRTTARIPIHSFDARKLRLEITARGTYGDRCNR